MDDIVAQAELLYLKGAEHERKGSFSDAVTCYKKSLQLVPDIDQRMRTLAISEAKEKATKPLIESNVEVGTIDEDFNVNESLADRFLRLGHDFNATCTPLKNRKEFHISGLPAEMLSYILRFVVTDELDLRSLEQCSLVCRGFYLCARDEEIWKAACKRVWKNLNTSCLGSYRSWREMYIMRPRVNTCGYYLAHETYYREGEQAFSTYRPLHFVIYYRYMSTKNRHKMRYQPVPLPEILAQLYHCRDARDATEKVRFFADGRAIMLCSIDPPAVLALSLRTVDGATSGTVFIGTYEYNEQYVDLKLQRKHFRPDSKRTNMSYHLADVEKYPQDRTTCLQFLREQKFSEDFQCQPGKRTEFY